MLRAACTPRAVVPSRRPAPIAIARAPVRALPIVRAAAAEVSVPAPAVAGPKSAKASIHFQRGSVHKVRRVLDVIRGRSYEEAIMLCRFLPYKACEPIAGVLLSAAANAKNNEGAAREKLYVSECFADGGPVMKRMRPRAQGRAYKILKRTFHLTIKVEERQ